MVNTLHITTQPSVIYKRLLSYVTPFKWIFVLGILGNVLYGIIDASFIKLMEPLLNKGFVDHDPHFVKWIPFIIIGIVLIRGVASFSSTYCMGWVSRQVVMSMRRQLFKHFMHLPIPFYDQNSSGELLSKLTYNVEQVADASTEALTVMVREFCTVIGLIIVMFSVSWQLTLLFFIIMPVLAYLMGYVSKRIRKVSHQVQSSVGAVAHVAEEAIEGHRVIKSFGGQSYEQDRFEKVTRANFNQEIKLVTTSALSIPAVQLIGSFALALTIYLATQPGLIEMTPGAFAALVGAMFMLLKPLKQLTKVNGNIQKGIANAASIFEVLDLPEECDNGNNEINVIQGKIEFKSISFAYEEKKPILKNISFHVEPGEVVAIVGRSGSGKSTLVNLISRFYEPQGEIFIDGHEIKTLKLSHLRNQLAYVSQHITLFNNTISQNIAYSDTHYNLDKVIDAAKKAHAWEFIEQLPDGLNTLIGENGIRLSGGQRQRLAIARAIYKKASILILDEATSALDSESERKIQSALDELMLNCTTIVIAHRLSTILNANKIVVLDKGKVVQVGTHQSLINQEGLYAELQLAQNHLASQAS